MEKTARTRWEKIRVLFRLYKLWMKSPNERLTQLIDNSTRILDKFYVGDDELVEHVERYVNGHPKLKRVKSHKNLDGQDTQTI